MLKFLAAIGLSAGLMLLALAAILGAAYLGVFFGIGVGIAAVTIVVGVLCYLAGKGPAPYV